MKFLVCISKAPDTTTKIQFTDNNTKFAETGVTFIINPYDEWYALVRAIELKEKLGGSVTVINVGGPDNEPIIRKALAIGADDAVRIDTTAVDSLQVAEQIAGYARTESFDVILCGKETIDYNGSEVGGMIAALLDMPFVSLTTSMELDGAVANFERDVSGGKEIFSCSLPCVVSASKGMSEPRIPNMRGIMAARTKPLKVVASTGGTAVTEVIQFELPAAKAGVKLVSPDQVEELVNLLHNEAKVI